jgi:hypothetical protein
MSGTQQTAILTADSIASLEALIHFLIHFDDHISIVLEFFVSLIDLEINPLSECWTSNCVTDVT